MKNIRNISKYLVFTGIVMAMALNAVAQQMSEATAKVVRIKGSARYASANNVWQPLKVGDVLRVGAIIQTASDSRVDLVLGEKDAVAKETKWGEVVSYQPQAQQDFVRVWENSVLSLDKLLVADTGTDKIRETELNLRAGRVFGMVKKLNGASKYEIKMPNAVAGIRGTIYTVSATGVVDVLVGSVVVAYMDANGQPVTQVVMGGQRFDASTGQVTPIPEFEQKEMVKSTKEQTGPNVPPTTFVHDNTTYWVSPTQGFNGSGASSGNN